MRLLSLLSICLLAGLARADETAPPIAGDKPALQEQARRLHDRGAALRNEAETEFAAANKACWNKFLVNSCMDEAKKAKIEKLAAARGVEQQAREIERNLRKQDYAERQEKTAEEAPQREAEAAARAESNRKAQQEAMERVERRRREAEQGGK